jgi:hypothetical protein
VGYYLPDEGKIVTRERNDMKKLMTLMLGLSLAFGTVAVAFSQDTTAKKSSKNKSKTKRKQTKKTDTTKSIK